MTLPTLYKRTSTGKIQEWTIEIDEEKYRTISGQTDGKKVTSEWTVAKPKNVGRSNATDAIQQALVEAKASWDKKQKEDYHLDINKIDQARYIEPMLAKEYDPAKPPKFPVYSQPKLDGMRCVITREGMFTRNGKPIGTCPHIFAAAKKILDQHEDIIALDGELYTHDYKDDFNAIISLVKRGNVTPDQLEEAEAKIEYWWYDSMIDELNFYDRFMRMANIVTDKCIVHVPTAPASDQDTLDKFYGEYMEDGYEGQMIRTDSPYEYKRTKALLKRKDFKDAEFTIIGAEEGNGNRAGQVGAFIFEIGDKQFKGTPKGTNEYRKNLWENPSEYMGKTATVKYFMLTPDGIPRFPVVTTIRDYE